MKQMIYRGLVVVACSLLVKSSYAQTPISALEKTVAQWMALRTTLAQEEAAWQDEEAALRREIALLQSEAQALHAEEANLTADRHSHAKTYNLLMDEQRRYGSVLTALGGAMGDARKRLTGLAPRMPRQLPSTLAGGFDQLDDTSINLVKQIQLVTALYTQLETAQSQLHHVTERLTLPDGSMRQADVLYVGLVRAFAVSPTSDWAAVGQSSAQGWQWQATPTIASAVRLAIDCYAHQKPAVWVALPWTIDQEVQP